MRGISAFNFQRFRQPIRSCGIVPTANQRYGQNLAVTSTNMREFVSGPISAVAIRENVWEPLKLGLISGYFGWTDLDWSFTNWKFGFDSDPELCDLHCSCTWASPLGILVLYGELIPSLLCLNRVLELIQMDYWVCTRNTLDLTCHSFNN